MPKNQLPKHITMSLTENLNALKEYTGNSAALAIRQLTVGGVDIATVGGEGMIAVDQHNKLIAALDRKYECMYATPQDIAQFVCQGSLFANQLFELTTFSKVLMQMGNGNLIVLIDGYPIAIAMTMPGFAYRSISQPDNEINERGSKEAFTEPIRVNMSLIQRRIKSDKLRMEMQECGTVSRTEYCLIWLEDAADPALLEQVRQKLKKVKLRQVLNSGYLQYFLEPKGFHLFPNVGQTERPDTLCAKLDEGRIGVLVDGNPFVLIVPYLFSENFQTMDDYCSKPYYATLMRLIKYLAFGLAVLLPGLYVAIGTFHQELVPHALLFSIVAAEETTPFSLMVEALVIHFLYEIMREAGLRLPKAIGHAVSIVGALVIGDVAVSAGLIGTPMVLVVALTAISSFVVPNLHQPVSLLRFLLIVIGGTSGLYGISLAIAAVAVNAASMQNGGVPYLSPISPLNATSLGDTFVRKNTKWLSRHHITINHLYGSNPPKTDSHKE